MSLPPQAPCAPLEPGVEPSAAAPLAGLRDWASANWQPTLEGPVLRLRALQAQDWDALYGVASDPLIWAQHPDSNRWQQVEFEAFFANALAGGGALLIADRQTGKVLGSSRYYEWDASQRSVAVGYTFLARTCWGGGVNGELKALMLDHAFAWVDRVWFHVGPNNLRSRKAMEKIGATYAHTAQRTGQGISRPAVFYYIDRADWLQRRSLPLSTPLPLPDMDHP